MDIFLKNKYKWPLSTWKTLRKDIKENITKEIQIKSTMKYHFTSTRIAKHIDTKKGR